MTSVIRGQVIKSQLFSVITYCLCKKGSGDAHGSFLHQHIFPKLSQITEIRGQVTRGNF